MASTVAIEEIARGRRAGPLWFQLYIQPDLGFTEAWCGGRRRPAARRWSSRVDSPVFGRRERDLRNGFPDLPEGMCCENMRDGGGPAAAASCSRRSSRGTTSTGCASMTTLPIALKGVAAPRRTPGSPLEHGVDALVVSNHGGRQLDGVPAAVDAAARRSPTRSAGGCRSLLDGGVRRGTDVRQGAARWARPRSAIGRPVLWGLAVDGEPGVRQVLDVLRAELERALSCAAATRRRRPTATC